MNNELIEPRIIQFQAHCRGVLHRNKKVLELCDVSEIDIDIPKLQECLTNGYFTPYRMEYYKSTSTQNLNLEDGFMEFITADCLSGKRVGEGHCPIDITKNDFGIDVLCVCLNGTYTNEKSIMQNFSKCGNNLDTLFEKNQFQEALNIYITEYYNKLLSAKKTKNLNKLYYCAFISTNMHVYIAVFKINLDSIANIKYDKVSKQLKSIKFHGFIGDQYGTTILFKSKKRLEIRLHKDILKSPYVVQLI